MKIIKQYWLVLTIFLLVSLLVLARTFTHKSFRYDAVKWAEPSAVRSNLLTKDQVMALSGKKMVISLGNDATVSKELRLSLIHISEPTRRTPISYAVFCLKKK